MTIIYVHGVKVRSPEHGKQLGRSFDRWLGPKLSVNNAPAGYEQVYWGDLASKFLWGLKSRPRTRLLGMGGAGPFPGLGALREADERDTPLDRAAAVPAPVAGPVLGAPAPPRAPEAPPLSAVARERRPDFLADLYLACRPAQTGSDPVADRAEVAALAAAAAQVAEQWDELVALEPNDAARAARLVAAVHSALRDDQLLAMGAFEDWMTKAGEKLRRAATWPSDAVSTVFGELRPIAHDFIANFVGDVFVYLNGRGTPDAPGEIQERILAALGRAQTRKEATGERIVIVSHSMGGQLVYDALTHFAPARLRDRLEVDHWITCGSQVSFFAELALFPGQPEPSAQGKLARPACVADWTNFYDLNDLVGFVMGPVFDGVQDIDYDTGYGLALAHTGFLARPSFFESMAARL